MVNIQEQVGEEYYNVVKDIFSIRSKRRELYGDTFNEMPSVGHFWHAFNKLKRLRYNIEFGNAIPSHKKYESAKDNAIDVINYMIFFLIMIEEEHKNKEVKNGK